MNEHPILFSAPMIRAVLAGTKTQTRRVVTVPWNKSTRSLPYEPWWVDDDGKLLAQDEAGEFHPAEQAMAPYGGPGDRLWVRETWAPWSEHIEERGEADAIEDARKQMPWACIVYRADANGGHVNVKKWRPSIFLPRWASRMSLDVSDVRIERLQAITPEDILAEGVVARAHHDPNLGKCPVSSFDGKAYVDLRSLWAAGWDSINGKKDGCAWADNPWVWRVAFKKGLAS
jgi:hypothetical protein